MITTQQHIQGIRRRKVFIVLGLFFLCLLLFYAIPAFAQNYVSLSGIPQIEGNANNRDLSGLLNGLYLIVVSVGSLLAVIKIAIAGVKYSMSDIVTNKQDAKKDIQGALLGLAILLLPYVILSTIYPGLVNLDILKNISTQQTVPTNSQAYINTIQNCWNTGGQVFVTTQGGNSTIDCRNTTTTSGTSTTSGSGSGGSSGPTGSGIVTQPGSLFSLNDPGNLYDGSEVKVLSVSVATVNGSARYNYKIQLPDGSISSAGCGNLYPAPAECN